MKPKVVVAGLGETGAQVCGRLAEQHQVIGIERSANVARDAAAAFAGLDAVRVHEGDATSALVLRHAGAVGAQAAIACLGSDEANGEFLRVAREQLGIEHLQAVLVSATARTGLESTGVIVVDRAASCAAQLVSRIEQGKRQASGVGLGLGEILEVEVLPGSPVVGKALAELRPKRWLVGAVYREQRLIVPHGQTVLAAGDRVLLVGDPDLLPAVANLIRSGESEFPLEFGSHVVVLTPGGAPAGPAVIEEAAYLVRSTQADCVEILGPAPEDAVLAQARACCDAAQVRSEATALPQRDLGALAAALGSRDLGILVLPPEPRPLRVRVGLGRSRTGRIADAVTSPVLIARGTHPYQNLLLLLAELPFPLAAARVAVDAARILGAELHLGVVHAPSLVVGAEQRDEMEETRNAITRLAGLYHVKLRALELEGNPIEEAERVSGRFDLLVLPLPRARRPFLTRPDVALNLVHRARCSVLALPV
jgi:hypothetical protein